jgi:hypothetical protein
MCGLENILQLQVYQGQFTKVCAALDDQDVPLVRFGSRTFFVNIVALPRLHAFRGVVKVVVTAEENVNSMCGSNFA